MSHVDLNLPAARLTALLNQGELTSEDLTTACLAAIEQRDPPVNAFLRVDRDRALAAARAIDARRSKGEPLGILAGLPVATKDVICLKGDLTTCGSKMLATHRSPFDAHVIERIRAADGVLLGRTNMDEFAMGSSGENSAFGPTRNPWDTTRTPGGSSSGSAAAVSARMVPLSLGSDTGGSIRQPASFCGIVGMKPTYGRVSRYGLVAYASSLDQIGPFATDVFGAALLLEAIAGPDQRDSTCINRAVETYSRQLEAPLEGLKIGLVDEHYGEGLDPEIAAAVEASCDVYRSLGATIHRVSLPHSKYSIAAYYLIACSEASSNLARYDGIHYGHRASNAKDLVELYARSRGEAFGEEVKRRIMLGVFSLSTGYSDQFYLKALKTRRLIRNDFDHAFQSVDLIAGPVAPTPPFVIGSKCDDPLAMYLSDIYTISANLAGLPGISVPAGMTSNGLPIGLQLQGPPFSESLILRAARQFEQATEWHLATPELARKGGQS